MKRKLRFDEIVRRMVYEFNARFYRGILILAFSP